MKPLGVGIIGFGHWYTAFWIARCLNEDSKAKLVAVSDPRKDKLKDFASRFNVETHEEYEEVLSRDDVDIVHVVPPPVKIPEYVIASAEAGKHIIMGKPMAMTLKEADEALRVVRKQKVKLVTWEGLIHLGEKATDKKIGRIASITTVMHQGIAEDWYGSGKAGWFADPTQVPGGAFIDEGIYTIEAHRFYASSEVKRINYARKANLVFKDIKVEDFCQANLTFKNGVNSSLEIGWTISQPEPKNLGGLTKANAFNHTYIIGQEGELAINGMPGFNVKNTDVLSREYPYWVSHRPGQEHFGKPSFKALDYLIECIEEDKEPVASGEHARKSLEVALAVYKAADTGSPVTLP